MLFRSFNGLWRKAQGAATTDVPTLDLYRATPATALSAARLANLDARLACCICQQRASWDGDSGVDIFAAEGEGVISHFVSSCHCSAALWQGNDISIAKALVS